MKALYESAKQIILSNYKGEITGEALDILTVSVMALFVRLPNVSKEKLPDILGKLEIYFGDKSIAEMVSERYPEYPVDEIGTSTNAFVTRALALGDDNRFTEEWSMYVSTEKLNNRFVNAIAKTTHELIHLLRFNGIVDSATEAKIRDGISVARCNKESGVVKRKHYNLEEGVVEDFTIKSLDALFEYIASEDVTFSPALDIFKKRYKKDFKPAYQAERFFIDGLTRDSKFAELLEYSFIDVNEPLLLISYYNSALNDASAFTRLSRGIDRAFEYAEKNDTLNFQKSCDELIGQINGFLVQKKN